MEASVEAHRAKMMHLGKIIPLSAMAEPFSKVATAYLLGLFLFFFIPSFSSLLVPFSEVAHPSSFFAQVP